MDIACQCVGCGALFKLDSRHLGRKAKCPQCGYISAATAAPEPSVSSDPTGPAAANRRRFAEASMSDDQITAPDISPEELGPTSKVVVSKPVAPKPAAASSPAAKPPMTRPVHSPKPTVGTPGQVAVPAATPVATGGNATTGAGGAFAHPSTAAPLFPPTSVSPGTPPGTPTGTSIGASTGTSTGTSIGTSTGTPTVATSGVSTSAGAGRAARRGRGVSRIAWVIGGGVAGLLLAIGSVVAVVISLSSGGGQPVVNAARSQAQLVLDLPADGRRNIKLLVDSQARTIPASGPVELSLAAGMHTLTIQRRGYQQIDHSFTLRRGERLPFVPAWEASLAPPIAASGADSGLAGGGLSGTGLAGRGVAGGGVAGGLGADGGSAAGATGGVPNPGGTAGPSGFPNWPQNFEVAQKQALASKRDIFLVFAGSDWSQQTQVMAGAIFAQPKFRSFVEQRFVPLVVDLPRTETGLNQLENINQNRSLSRQFGVRSVPVVLLLDAGGTPYAADGFFGDSLDKYIQHITLLQNKRAQRDVRLEAVDRARDKSPEEYLNAMEQAVRWIEQERLTPHYGTIFARWLALARQLDPQNELGKQEVFFEADWIARLNEAMVDGERIKVAAVLGDLLNWSKARRFADPDRAVRVHLSSAMLLLQAMDDEEAAVRHVDLARKYAPTDDKLKDDLANVEKWARQREQLSSGTGFVIAAEGYLLTNHHVVAGPGRTVVRVPVPGPASANASPENTAGNPAGTAAGNAAGNAAADPAAMRNVPAEVVASDPKQDIAILKVDPAAFSVFTPLALGGERVRRGAEVAVFGFPLGDELGKDVRITTGVVHSPSDQSDDKRHVLDCRINPGNSGGPVLNRFGHVIGMVTAKTVGGVGVDSYGVAIPATDLQTFLQAHLPAGAVRPLATSSADGGGGRRREWEEIDASVSPGVLMVLKLKEP